MWYQDMKMKLIVLGIIIALILIIILSIFQGICGKWFRLLEMAGNSSESDYVLYQNLAWFVYQKKYLSRFEQGFREWTLLALTYWSLCVVNFLHCFDIGFVSLSKDGVDDLHVLSHTCRLCTIIVMLITYIHSVILIFCSMLLLVSSGQYAMTMTAPFGIFAWSGVFLATAGLVMFYKCSRYF